MFPMVSLAMKMEIICESYTTGKLTYKLSTLGFITLLEFHLMGSFLLLILAKGMV